MGMGGNENSTFSHFQLEEENQPISGATSAFPGTSAYSDTLDCHIPPAKKRHVFDFQDLWGPEDDQQQSRNELAEYVNLNGMGAGGNRNNQWEWEGNVNKTRLNVGSGMRMGMNHWEWEGMRLKKTFRLISTSHPITHGLLVTTLFMMPVHRISLLLRRTR